MCSWMSFDTYGYVCVCVCVFVAGILGISGLLNI